MNEKTWALRLLALRVYVGPEQFWFSNRSCGNVLNKQPVSHANLFLETALELFGSQKVVGVAGSFRSAE